MHSQEGRGQSTTHSSTRGCRLASPPSSVPCWSCRWLHATHARESVCLLAFRGTKGSKERASPLNPVLSSLKEILCVPHPL